MSRSTDRARAVLGVALAVSAVGIAAARPEPLGAVEPPASQVAPVPAAVGADIRALERRTERSASRLGLTATRRSPLPVALPTLVSRERALGNVAAFLDARHEVLRDIEQPLMRPVAGLQTSPFGVRWGRMHEGIDIGGPVGTPIRAAAPGVVVSAGWNAGYGRIVVIRHPGGLSTAYAHMSAISVARGRPVAQGDVVGRRGDTGHSTGPHLHFETRLHGRAVDPAPYLRRAPRAAQRGA